MKLSKLILKNRGSVTVFLALIMLPTIIFSTAIVDGARISVAKNITSGAGDMAMNAALASYDQVLKDVYGLFAMSKSPKDVEVNLKMYFENTLQGIAIGSAEDAYTQNFLDSIKLAMTGLGDRTFDNFIDIQTEMFSAKAPSNGNLANPDIMKRQILDFMKYRGPINFGMSFFDKISALKQVSQQSDAIEKKIKYETKLDDVQKEFNKAYAAIEEYKKAIKDLSTVKIEQALKDTKADIEKINGVLFYGYANTNARPKAITPDQTNSNSVDDKSTTIDLFIQDSVYKKLKADIEAISALNASYSDAAIKGVNVVTRVQYIYAVNAYIERFNLLAGYYRAYTTWYGRLSNEARTEDIKTIYSSVTSAYNIENNFALRHYELANRIYSLFKSEINDTAKARGEYLRTNILNPLDTAAKESKKAHDALEAARKAFSDATTARSNWKNSIDKLSGDARTPMQADYQTSAAKLDETKLKELEDALYKDNNADGSIYKYYTNVKAELEKAKYMNTSILTAGTEWFTNFADNCRSEATNAIGATKEIPAIGNLANNFFNSSRGYVGADISKVGAAPKEINKESYAFYDYLTKNCKLSISEKNKKLKEDAETTRNGMLKKGSSENMQKADSAVTGTIADISNLPSTLRELQNSKQEASNHTEITMRKSGLFGLWGDEKPENAETSFSTNTSFFKILSDLPAAALENVFIMEYAMNMFSYNTIDKQNKGKAPKTLTNVPINPNNNLLYKGEVEYLLWGKADAKDNVNNTIASIFGIRFVMNSIFALSNANINAMTLPAATAIAGWSGFGVPLVNTVLKLAIAVAESTIDIKLMMDGDKVVMLKTWNTWKTKLESALHLIKDELLDAAEAKALEAYSNFKDFTYEKLTEKKDELKGDMQVWLRRVAKSAIDDAKSAVVSQLQNILTSIALDDAITNSASAIDAELTKSLESLKATLDIKEVSEEEDPVGAMKNSAYKYLVSEKTNLIATIIELKNQYANPEVIAQDIGVMISEKMIGIFNKLEAVGSGLVDKAYETTWNSVSKKMDSIVEDNIDSIKKEVSGEIDGYLAKLGGTGQAQKGLPSTEPKDIGNNAAATGFALGYSDYLRIFIYINLINTEKENMILCRIGDLIQLNMQKTQKSNFQMQNAFTHVEINSKVSVRTTLVQFTQGQATKSRFGNRYVINLKSVLGY